MKQSVELDNPDLSLKLKPKYYILHQYNPPNIVFRSQALIPHASSKLLNMFRERIASKACQKSYNLRSREALLGRYFEESQEMAIPPPLEGIGFKVGEDSGRARKRQKRTVEDKSNDSYRPVELDQGSPLPSSEGGVGIQPVKIDGNVSFDDIGGLSGCIAGLKEMVFFPLLYPDFFASYGITPPKGVLFCGPPGTGKTLTARALAYEISKYEKTKITFYMVNGADILSKWIGEAERELKLLFENARSTQPSIIFFDEIDGIAPVRSSKHDQAHNSIVSTLLSQMDGLDSRGQVVLIGATNRVDAVDGALRRPGRFDREVNFSLPDSEARAQILDKHTHKWKEPPSEDLKRDLAATCVGYCGADLKALCTEATLRAFRGRYPQAYSINGSFLVDVDSVKVGKSDFLEAMTTISPAAHRGSVVNSRPLPPSVLPCMQRTLKEVMRSVSMIFPAVPICYRPRLLLYGNDGVGLEHLGPAVLHELEEFPIHSLALPTLLSDPGGRAPEEALRHVFREAEKRTPSILYLPHFHFWWESAHEHLKGVLQTLLADLRSDLPILLLGTSFIPLSLICDSGSIFSEYHVFRLSSPSRADISMFFDSLIEARLSIEPDNVAKILASSSKAPKVAARTELRAKDAMHVDIATLLQRANNGKLFMTKLSVEDVNLILAKKADYLKSQMDPSLVTFGDKVGEEDNPDQSFATDESQADAGSDWLTAAQVSERIQNHNGEVAISSSSQVKFMKQLLLEHFKDYNIAQLQRLFTSIMDGLI